MDILKLIKEKAQSKLNQILLIEGEDERIIKAASMCVEEKICYPVLIGRKEAIIKLSAKAGASLDGIKIVDHLDFEEIDTYVDKLVELRGHKGVDAAKARELLKDPNYFGAMMLKLGDADGAVGGCKYSTADWMRPVFQIIKTKEGVKTVSAVCFMVMGEKTVFFSDTDFNIKPDFNELAQIAINANDFVKSIGVAPKVAMLSYSTKGSGEHESLEDIRAAIDSVKKKRPDIVIDGEMQLDAATNPDSAKRKCPDSVLKGEANLLVFPDITVGNVLIHALTQWTDFRFFGSFPVGLAKPVMNGGRSFGVQEVFDIISACAMEVNS